MLVYKINKEKNFLEEIGIKYNDQIFWKFYGSDICDAVCDEYGVQEN